MLTTLGMIAAGTAFQWCVLPRLGTNVPCRIQASTRQGRDLLSVEAHHGTATGFDGGLLPLTRSTLGSFSVPRALSESWVASRMYRPTTVLIRRLKRPRPDRFLRSSPVS